MKLNSDEIYLLQYEGKDDVIKAYRKRTKASQKEAEKAHEEAVRRGNHVSSTEFMGEAMKRMSHIEELAIEVPELNDRRREEAFQQIAMLAKEARELVSDGEWASIESAGITPPTPKESAKYIAMR